MAAFIVTEKPTTLYLTGLKGVERIVILKRGLKSVYFSRDLAGKYDNIKVNLRHSGSYEISSGKVAGVTPIEITPLNIELPIPERDRIKEYKIIYNKNLTGSPARNFSKSGTIEIGTRFAGFDFPTKVFILLHEVGHFYYKTEKYCDIFAAKNFIEMGYNNSSAIYALTKVLNTDTGMNQDRIKFLFNHLNKIEK